MSGIGGAGQQRTDETSLAERRLRSREQITASRQRWICSDNREVGSVQSREGQSHPLARRSRGLQELATQQARACWQQQRNRLCNAPNIDSTISRNDERNFEYPCRVGMNGTHVVRHIDFD